ncbi:MAG: hypothetical protein K2X48_02125 [Chitinophagaceae bacterium]|nr:hypothetical protein [Chitinophagaceae bacterium]
MIPAFVRCGIVPCVAHIIAGANCNMKSETSHTIFKAAKIGEEEIEQKIIFPLKACF